MKIDLHCHSKYSKRPTLWIMQKLGCPESFTEPLELYHLARQKGMDGATITDHNVIDGALEIQHLPNTFLGCEYTTYFPEDRCKVHILVYGFEERQHADLTAARENIFDLVSYVHQHQLPHVCAHPLFWVNDRLTIEHIEQLVLLFKNWEVNGDISPHMNEAVRQLVTGLTREDIERLAEKHNIIPHFPEPWKKNLSSGSDDHSSLNLARAYTEVPGARTLTEFWDGLEHGQAKLRSQEATPLTFSRNIYGIAYQFYKSKFDLERYVHKDIFLRFTDRALQTRLDDTEPWLAWFHMYLSSKRRPRTPDQANGSLIELARMEAEKLIRQQPQLMALVRDGKSEDMDQQWFEFVKQVSNRVMLHFGNHLLDRVVHARFFDIFHSIGSAGALYGMLAPYFVSFSLFAKQRSFSERVLKHFQGESVDETLRPPRVAHFTDTFHEVNGVARTLNQQLATAQELGKDYRVVTCHADRRYRRGVAQFEPVGAYTVPEYPELQLLMPPFLEMLGYCYEEGITDIHVSTPGPVGLAALGIARILSLPVSGTYHTALPQYAKALTDDGYVEEVSWRYMLWFYNQLDAVYVPSRATGAELIEKGIKPEKIRVYPRGVNIDRFNPSRRNGVLAKKYGVAHEETTLLYVGRISKEKNLHRLTRAYKKLLSSGLPARLVVAGDGPYREEMARELKGTPAVFTGYLEGDDLPDLYASCDILVFPSATDTFGNVVLEAQASGIPVIVSDQGGPRENMLPDETGLVVPADNVDAWTAAMAALISEPARRREMGSAARAYMETRGFKQAFARLWDMYAERPEPGAEPAQALEPFEQMLAESARALAG